MLAIPRLNGAQDVDGRNVGASESAIVDNLFDARTSRGNLSGEISQTSWPIADHGVEPAEATVGDQTAFDHATQDIRINIASAEDKDDTFAGQFGQLTGEASSKRGGGRALDYAFLQLDDP